MFVMTILGSPLNITLQPPEISRLRVAEAFSVTVAEPLTLIEEVFVLSPMASTSPEPEPDTSRSSVDPEIVTFEDPAVLIPTFEFVPLTLIVDELAGLRVNTLPSLASLRFEDPNVLAEMLSAVTLISAFEPFDRVISAVFALIFKLEIIDLPDIFSTNELAVSNGVVEFIDELSAILIILTVGIKTTAFKTGFIAFLPLNIFLTSDGIDFVSKDMYRV